MTEKPDPTRLLDIMQNLLTDLDDIGADIAAARLSGAIDALRDKFDLN
jgi:hypothetical protein